MDVVKRIIKLAGGKVVQAEQANRAKFLKWVQAPLKMKPFLFLSKKELIDHPLFWSSNVASNAAVNNIREALAT